MIRGLAAAAEPVGTGIFLDPTTGQLLLTENPGVAFGVAVWIVGLVLGLATAWLVLP